MYVIQKVHICYTKRSHIVISLNVDFAVAHPTTNLATNPRYLSSPPPPVHYVDLLTPLALTISMCGLRLLSLSAACLQGTDHQGWRA